MKNNRHSRVNDGRGKEGEGKEEAETNCCLFTASDQRDGGGFVLSAPFSSHSISIDEQRVITPSQSHFHSSLLQ